MGSTRPVPADTGAECDPAGQEAVLREGDRSRITRRRPAGGRETRIVKTFLGPRALQRARQERRMLERLAGVAGVPQIADWPPAPDCLVFVDDGATAATPWPAERVGEPLVRFAAALARTLSAVHARGVVHRNIHPDTVLLNPGDAPLLVDFSLAASVAEERPAFVHHSEIAGELPYLAPEQTGRTGRAIDHRADLYALGATLYALATGRPPFEESDPLRLIHAVLARTPEAPQLRNPALPAGFAAILVKLLDKSPERRYQSAEGLAHDLSRLAEALARGEDAVFALGERDFPLRLAPPAQLVGRDTEIAGLRTAFQSALTGGGTVLVSGPPGVGKTALVNELRSMVAERGGWFASGKFDPHRSDLAADAVYQVYRALGRLLLAEPEATLSPLRERIRTEVDGNLDLIRQLQPETALLLGLEKEGETDLAAVSPDRLLQTSVAVLRSIVSPARPVVMVIDDLQWADAIPLGFVDLLTSQRRLPGLLLVGCYREAEIDAVHPLAPLLARWRTLPDAPLELSLDDLPAEGLGDLLGHMLRLPAERAMALAGAVGPHTGGNPYATIELINTLRDDDTLHLAADGWQWDGDEIRRHLSGREVVELLAARIGRLPGPARRLIDAMACLGGDVGADVLRYACGLDAASLEADLGAALEDGLLIVEQRGEGIIRFRHDQIQFAAHRRLDAELRARLHLDIARRLAPHPDLAALAAEQYLGAPELISDAAERRLAAHLLHGAARDTRLVNYTATERFARAGLALLRPVAQPSDNPLLEALAVEQQAALYRLGRLDEADACYAQIASLVTEPLAGVEAACVHIACLTNRGRAREAVDFGLAQLERLDVDVPTPAALDARIANGMDTLQQWIAGADVEADVRAREVDDPRVLAVARIINRMMPPAFFCDSALMAWLALESGRLWAAHGPCAALVGPFAHVCHVCSVSGTMDEDHRLGYRAMNHLLAVSEARGYEPDTSQARFLFALGSAHWLAPRAEALEHARRAREGLLRGGDVQNACFTYYASWGALLDCSPHLDPLVEESAAAVASAERTGNQHAGMAYRIYHDFSRRLRGEIEPGWAQRVDAAANPTGAANLHVHAALDALLFGDAAQLVTHALASIPLRPFVEATQCLALSHLLEGLALATRLREAPAHELGALRDALDACLAWHRRRADEAPANFAHVVTFLEAEAAWAAGDHAAAIRSFDEVLGTAAIVDHPWLHALITERAGLCHLAHGLRHGARLLLAEAHRAYADWGAVAKAEAMARAYGWLHTRRYSGSTAELATTDAADLMAVLRASQALSSETGMARLHSRVAELLGTLTGAQRVQLVVHSEDAGGWVLVREGGIGDALPVDLAGERGLLACAVFHYVERTGEALAIDDATRDERFAHDPGLEGMDCCAMLAVPILTQGRVRAVLLLENRSAPGAFGGDRLDAVQLIAGQLAVSLENALLYERLEQRVEQRTRQLRDAQKALMSTARQAGMAEIATNVLHNVGNVLNSVNVSAALIGQHARALRTDGLARAARMIEAHADDLAAFLRDDEKGRMLPAYLAGLAASLSDERRTVLTEVDALSRSVDHIKDIVATQQSYAGATNVIEPVDIAALVDDALRMNAAALARHDVHVAKHIAPLPELRLDKAKVLQILVNLISNAKHAMDPVSDRAHELTISAERIGAGRLRLRVSDVGVGIPPENLTRIFAHGFTTRAGGHGFGLHSCALAVREMGGTLTAHSDGPDRGAVFTLELPVDQETDTP